MSKTIILYVWENQGGISKQWEMSTDLWAKHMSFFTFGRFGGGYKPFGTMSKEKEEAELAIKRIKELFHLDVKVVYSAPPDKEQITLKVDELDGKKIAYSTETEFHIQVGRGKKGAYKRTQVITGNLGRAVMHYNMLNIGNGYKKRLVMSGEVIARFRSEEAR